MILKNNIRYALMFLWVFLSFNQVYAESLMTAVQYDSGAHSAIARSGYFVVEVHSSGYFNTLWYRVGFINGNRVEWGKSYPYDKGLRASIAIVGDTVVETHESVYSYKLWYRVGTLNADTKTISWGNLKLYGNGSKPSIALNGNIVLEAHDVAHYHSDGYMDPDGTYIDTSYYTYTISYGDN